MKRMLTLGLCSLFLFVGCPTFAYKTGSCHGYEENGCKDIHVSGYHKQDGTYVQDYYRSSPKRY